MRITLKVYMHTCIDGNRIFHVLMHAFCFLRPALLAPESRIERSFLSHNQSVVPTSYIQILQLLSNPHTAIETARFYHSKLVLSSRPFFGLLGDLGTPGAICKLELINAFTFPAPGISCPGITSNISTINMHNQNVS